jgi:hypothetical protein
LSLTFALKTKITACRNVTFEDTVPHAELGLLLRSFGIRPKLVTCLLFRLLKMCQDQDNAKEQILQEVTTALQINNSGWFLNKVS